MDTTTTSPSASDAQQQQQHLSLAFCGNSMLYYNDTPRLLEQMLQAAGYSTKQDSCLRGGASLISLWQQGNGMQDKFATENARLVDTNNGNGDEVVYDIGAPTVQELFQKQLAAGDSSKPRRNIVIMNDYTQSPARETTRQATCEILRTTYLPAMLQAASADAADADAEDDVDTNNQKLELLLIQTPAYRFPNMKDTQDLGDFDHFTNLLARGCETYRQLVSTEFNKIKCRVAPNGEAYRYLHHHNQDLWTRLYFVEDHFHPSPHGTYLQACVLFLCIVLGSDGDAAIPIIPTYNPDWWNTARRMQPKPTVMPLPTLQEAAELAQAAHAVVCGGDGIKTQHNTLKNGDSSRL